MTRLLTFSSLYPNSVQPAHGVFVETRLRHLLQRGDIQSCVVAPVPWFPSTDRRFGEYASFASVPRAEERHGIAVVHPRFLRLPKVGMSSAPFTLARAGIVGARQLMRNGYDFDVIDAHYFFPDGVAAIMMGRVLGKPVVITARGTDINLIPKYALPRKMILWAARESAAVITVCSALRDELVALGAEAAKIEVLRNGVDLTLFHPEERSAARRQFGLSRFAIASVGHLITRKGHDLVIGALPALPHVDLLIAGTGPEETALRNLAEHLHVSDRVRFLGSMPQERLRTLYSAVDALVLASSREGWANVLLEAMACGTPVVASNVWGTPEVVATAAAGLLMRERSRSAVAEAVARLRSAMPDRLATRRYAEGFSWDATTNGQLAVFGRILSKGRHEPATRFAH